MPVNLIEGSMPPGPQAKAALMIERAFQMLAMLGVSRDRAGEDIANGIDVLSSRHRREIAAKDLEIERLQRLLDARPPYYCRNCQCANCGNTLPRA